MVLSLTDFERAPLTRACKCARSLAGAPDDVRALAEQALAGDPGVYPASTLARILSEHSTVAVSDDAVRKHRSRTCCCGA